MPASSRQARERHSNYGDDDNNNYCYNNNNNNNTGVLQSFWGVWVFLLILTAFSVSTPLPALVYVSPQCCFSLFGP